MLQHAAMRILMAYLSLFLTAFIAATLLPLSSEALLATLIYQQYSPLLLWLVATLGNSLGSCINWYIGTQILHWQDKKWFPFSAEKILGAQQRFARYGQWSLLFAWVPVIGDPLTLVAGVMRMPFIRFFIVVLIGKALRYAIIVWFSLHSI